MKILIVGGYGIFGGRLAQSLANQSQLKLFIAGRSIKDAQAFCNQFNNSAAKTYSLHFDRNDSDIEAKLRMIKPDLLVDASGPFQTYGKDPYRMIKACLATSINYVDLADGSNFVKGVSQFDAEAKAKNIYVLSGASSFPVLTASVVRRLAEGLTRVQSIKGGIAPSPYAIVGLNVIRAIASYAGQRVLLVRDGQPAFGYAFTETMRYTICPPGCLPLNNLRFSLVDVPDLQTLPDLWPNIDSIWMGAGPTPEILHRMLNALAWLVRWGFISSLLPFARLFYWSINLIRWGDHRGGMFVSIEGFDSKGDRHQRTWHLLAEGNDGPYIPSMAIEAIVRRTLDGKKPASGARAATTDLELEDFESIFRNRTIYTGQRESRSSNEPVSSLYQHLLGQAWYQLPESLRTMHTCPNLRKAVGAAQVERGSSIIARCIAMMIGFPKAGHDIPVHVVFKSKSNGEVWIRTFIEKSFSSWQTQGTGRSDKLLIERFGPFTFGLALVVNDGKLYLIIRNWSCFGIRLPLFLAPNGNSYEFDEDGRFCFHVEIKHRFAGLIVRYRGWLLPID